MTRFFSEKCMKIFELINIQIVEARGLRECNTLKASYSVFFNLCRFHTKRDTID
jgi:hypothetical protein